jgi:hypothetical protein
MPIGCQIIAGKGSDAAVLGFAVVLEKALEKLGDAGGGCGPDPDPEGAWSENKNQDAKKNKRSVVGWGPAHRAVGVGESARFHEQ